MNREELIAKHMVLAIWWSRRFAKTGIDFEDLKAAAYEGLVIAANKYDPSKGEFETFAGYEIKYSLMAAVADYSGPVRVPQDARSALYSNPTRVSEKTKEAAKKALQPAVFLDAPIVDGENYTLKDKLGCIDVYPSNYGNSEYVETLLSILTEKETRILVYHYGLDGSEPLTFQQIGELEGITESRVSQIEKNALQKMRQL